MSWMKNINKINQMLNSIRATDKTGRIINIDLAFNLLSQMTEDVRKTQKTIYCIGNGASASMASHFSADMAKNGQLHTQVFSDLALITAISNDIGYDEVFSEPLRRRATCGDMLLAISSSGASSNIIKALNVANESGLKNITVSGMDFNNPISNMGDINFYCAAKEYGYIESVHAVILHYWIDCVVNSISKK
jgi:D-sedoheptulose 7-phosphate isomerase